MEISKNIQDILELSASLQDGVSRHVFWARLQADADLLHLGKTEMEGVKQLASVFNKSNQKKKIVWDEKIIQAAEKQQRIVLYASVQQ